MKILSFIHGLYFLLFSLTPFIMSAQTSEIFEFNKLIFIYICTILITTGWVIYQIWYKPPIKKIPLLIFLVLFVFSQFLSTVFSIDQHTSLYGYYGRFNGGLFSILTYSALFLVALQVFDRQSVLRLLKISFFTSVVVMCWGLLSKFNVDFSCLIFTGKISNACWTNQFQPAVRMFATLGQPNWLGAYLAIHFFIGLIFLARRLTTLNNLKAITMQKIFANWDVRSSVIAGILCINLLCIYFTKSRSSLLAVAGGIISIIFVLAWHNLPKYSKLFQATLLITIVAVIFYLSTLNLSDIQIRNISESFDIRKVVWKGGMDLGFKYPLFGTGVETFAYSYYFTRPVEHNYTSEWDFLYNKAHNEFVNYFATTGFLGIFTYCLWIFGSMWYLQKKMKEAKHKEEQIFHLFLLAALVAIHITNFFGFSTTTIQLFTYVIPALAYGVSQKNIPVSHSPSVIKYGLTFFSILVSMAMLVSTFKYRQADILFTQADRLPEGEFDKSIDLIDQAINLKKEHVYQDKLSTNLAAMAYLVNAQTGTAEAQLTERLISLSQKYNLDSLQQSPSNVLYFKTQAKNFYLFFEATGDERYIVKALQALDQARRLSPTDPKLWQTQALFYQSLAGNYDKEASQSAKYKKRAIVAVKQALKLKPNFTEALELEQQLLK